MVCLQNLTDVLLQIWRIGTYGQCTTKGIHDSDDFRITQMSISCNVTISHGKKIILLYFLFMDIPIWFE